MDDVLFCTACGNRRDGAARFCGRCGMRITEVMTAEASQDEVGHGAPTGGGPDAAAPSGFGAPPQAAEPRTGPMTVVPPRSSPVQGHTPDRQGACGAPAAHPNAATLGVWTVAAFTRGDWVGAAAAVGAGVGVAAVLSAAAVLLLDLADLPAITVGNVIALVAMVVALSFGGSVSASASTGITFGGTSTTVSGSTGVDTTPLLITAAALVALSIVFLHRLRSRRTGLVDVVTQAARVWVLLCAALLVVGFVGRTSPDAALTGTLTAEGPRIVVAAGIAGTLFGATVWLVLALALTIAWRLPAVLPPRVRAWRDVAGGPAAGACVAVLVGCVLLGVGGLTAALLDGGASGSGGLGTSLANAGVGPVIAGVLLFAPNLLLGAFGFASGVPLTAAAESSGTNGLSTGSSTSLLDATALIPELWLAPLAVAIALMTGGVIAALHAPDVAAARRHGWLTGAALGAALGVIAVATSVSANGGLLGASIGGTAHLDYVLAPLAGLVWGALGGVLGALVAPGLPDSVVQTVRRHVVGTRQRALDVAVPAPLASGPGRDGTRRGRNH